MIAKKTAQPRRKISFAVDRAEIDINSDWVEAVMTPPVRPASIPSPSLVLEGEMPLTATRPTAESAEAASVFVARQNNATVANNDTGAQGNTAEERAPVEELATVVESRPVAIIATEEQNATDIQEKTGGYPVSVRDNNATVVKSAPVVIMAVDNEQPVLHISRTPRRRPITRITDGLTPGQYAVYSLMYEAAQSVSGAHRIYKGGYADLGRLTGMSKRGIQNVIAELQAKHVIELHEQPGHHRTETSAYRMSEPAAVINHWFALDLRYAIGKSKTLSP